MKTELIHSLERIIPEKKITVDAAGKLLMTSIPYYFLLAITLAGYFALENHAFIFIIIIYSIIPLLDEVLSLDCINPSREQRLILEENNIWFKLALYFTAICDWLLFFKIMDVFVNY